jgi:DivIVA domain-containing protein
MGPIPTVLPPEEIANREFTRTIRGFDAEQVREFLAVVASTHRDLRMRITRLEAEVERATQGTDGDHVTVVDGTAEDDVLLEEMRRATSEVINAAREAAAEMRLAVEADVREMRATAKEQAAAIVAEARLASESEGEAIVEEARREAEAILARAHDEQESVRADITEMRARRQELAASLDRVMAGAHELLKDLTFPNRDGPSRH